MKKSIFTVETPIDEGILLFNTVNTALVRLTYSEQTWYKQILENESMDCGGCGGSSSDKIAM